MYEEEEDEDYMNDIISLNHDHIKTVMASEEPIIDLATSSDDEPEDDKSQIGISWYGNRSFVLPITFFDVSSNVEFLKKCRPLSIKVVDCNKHPSYYEKLLRHKSTNSAENFPILAQTIHRENGGTDEANAKISTVTEKQHSESNINTKSIELNTTVTKVIIPVPNYSQSKHKIDQGKAQVSPKSHTRIPNSERENQKVFKSKYLTPSDSKRNKSLVELVVSTKAQGTATHGHKIHSTDKKTTNEIAKKDLVEDVSTALRKKFETMINGLIENEIKDLSEKRCKSNSFTNEVRERSKNIEISYRNEQNIEGSPTRCSIKITPSKVFEKAIKLKNTHNKKSTGKANSELNMTSISENTTTKDQTVPKLSLKRKNSELKEFYVINPTKEKSKSHSPNKKSKISEERRGRLISKHKHIKATNETQRNSAERGSKIVSYIKDSPVQSTLTSSSTPRKLEQHRKSVIVTPSDDTSSSNIKSIRNYRHLKNDTTTTQLENKLLKNLAKCYSVYQKSEEEQVKSKNRINCLNPTSSDAKVPAKKIMENNSAFTGHVSQYNVVEHNVSHEKKRPNRYVVIQKSPPARFKSTIKNIINKALQKSMEYQDQNVSLQKPIEPVVSVANSHIPNISQTGRTAPFNKGTELPSMKQSGANSDWTGNHHMLYPENQINLPQNLYPKHNNVPNPNTTRDSANDFNSPSNLEIPKSYVSRHQNNLGLELSNNFLNDTPLPGYKGIGSKDGLTRPQEKEMQQMTQSTQPHRATKANDCSNFARSIIYSKPPVNKAIILKGSPAHPQPNIHPHYSNPIPTVVNHNVYHPRLPVVRPPRFMSPWPPPNTNVVQIGPQVNVQYNNPHCRMPFVSINFPRQPMYVEHWQQPMNENYGNNFMCLPPQPPPPPPAVPDQRNMRHSLPVEPPAPTGSIIGSNAEGQWIKKITITARPLSEPTVVHEKEKMLAELNSAVEEIEAASEKSVENVNKDPKPVKINALPNAKPNSSKPCPLSKKKNTNSLQNKINKEVEEKAKAVLAKEAKGYSPPILPIPSYQQAFEILAKNDQKMTDKLKKMEAMKVNKEVTIKPMKKTTIAESKNKQINSKPERNKVDQGPKSKPPDSKSTKTKILDHEKRKYEKTKKISLEEYKKKLASDNVTVSESSKRKCKKRKKLNQGLPVDKDLGYDSDATLVL